MMLKPYGGTARLPSRVTLMPNSTSGLMYYNGEGVPQDYQEAVSWFRLAAEQGDASAQFNLGVIAD